MPHPPASEVTDLSHAPWLVTGKQISRGFQGGVPLGRRPRVHAPPEKGRQGASMELRRPSEGGKRSCSPSELTFQGGVHPVLQVILENITMLQ
jgi:hypothetical protein